MMQLRALAATIRSTRIGRGFVYALILHVIALFSLLPFGQPVIAWPEHALAGPGPTALVPLRQGAYPADTVFHARSGDGRGASYDTNVAGHQVKAYRHQTERVPLAASPTGSRLFIGLRGCASVPAAKARHVAFSTRYRPFLRAPPAAG